MRKTAEGRRLFINESLFYPLQEDKLFEDKKINFSSTENRSLNIKLPETQKAQVIERQELNSSNHVNVHRDTRNRENLVYKHVGKNEKNDYCTIF